MSEQLGDLSPWEPIRNFLLILFGSIIMVTVMILLMGDTYEELNPIGWLVIGVTFLINGINGRRFEKSYKEQRITNNLLEKLGNEDNEG